MAVIIGFFGFIFFTGILAAIAIPQFAKYRNRAAEVMVKVELQNLLVLEQEYFAEYNKYTTSFGDLNYEPSKQEITIEVIGADRNCFEATGVHSNINKVIMIDCNGFSQE